MTTYYVRKSGLSTNDGLSPNTAWDSPYYSIANNTVICGDTVYVGSGVYFLPHETIFVTRTGSSYVNIIGDIDGKYTGDSGYVVITNNLSGSFYSGSGNQRNLWSGGSEYHSSSIWINFENIQFRRLPIGDPASNINFGIYLQRNRNKLKFKNCLLANGQSPFLCIDYSNPLLWSYDITFDNCVFEYGSLNAIRIANSPTMNLDTSSWFDYGITCNNCYFNGRSAAFYIASVNGTGSFRPNGFHFNYCTFHLGGTTDYVFDLRGQNNSLFPTTVYNCLLYCINGFTNTSTSASVLLEDNNFIIYGTTARSNVQAGLNSFAAGKLYATHPKLDFGISHLFDKNPRTSWEPLKYFSNICGFVAPYPGSGSEITTDMFDRPRPSGTCDSRSLFYTGYSNTRSGSGFLSDYTQNWDVHSLTNCAVEIIGGTGYGQRRFCIGNLTSSLLICPPWTIIPDDTSQYKVYNRGILPAVGCCESHDFGQLSTEQVDSSTYSLKLIGPGDHQLYVPVTLGTSSLSVKCWYDGNHGNNTPKLTLLQAPLLEINATSSISASNITSSWQTLTLPVYASGSGIVQIRLESRANTGSALTYWDTIKVV